MTTWAEPEFLCKERHTAWPGFSPRAYHKLAVARPPCTDAKIKVHQKQRCPWEDTCCWHIWGYHTWLDVGRLPPLFPSRPDIPYDSNVWRWITTARTYCMPQPPVPPPSEMDENTYLKFITQGTLFLDQKHKEKAMAQIQKELQEYKRLKIMSECRAPPLNSQGNILPPKEFNRYKHLIAGRGLRSLYVQLQPVKPATRDCWDLPCPSLQPHYQETAQRLALRNSSPVYEELLQRYQELAVSGRQMRHQGPVSKQNTAH
ncbi:testis-expressed protein 52 [Pelodiscus sinensis]|uniref:testis-expressed protein 52 n=1 Tax=Pelodiscus sinensis TaxID=13735 RepID=UPI003F6A606D